MISLQYVFISLQLNRGVEQLVARRAHNPKVAGSSPASATTLCKSGLNIESDLFF